MTPPDSDTKVDKLFSFPDFPQTVATKSWTAMPGLFPAHFWLCLGAQGSQGSQGSRGLAPGSMIPWLENRPWLLLSVSKSSILNGT